MFDNFSAIFSTELPKRMEREVANLPSLQLWRKSCNKRALDASSSTIVNKCLKEKDWDHVCKAKASKRKSGGFGVKRLTDKWRDQTYSVKLFYHELDNYFIENELWKNLCRT